MAQQKLYAGVKLREVRGRLGLTQTAFAGKLGVSLPYLNQMENNHRPVSAGLVLALAQEFGFDVTELSTGEAERMVADMREALADPIFADAAPPLAGPMPIDGRRLLFLFDVAYSGRQPLSKAVDGATKEHHFIRADTYGSKQDADDCSVLKAKQIIDEQGDKMFRNA